MSNQGSENLKKRTFLAAAVAACIGLGGASTVAEAATVGIAGVETKVTVTAPLGALGLSGAPFGTATADVSGANPVFTFPITGGTIDSHTDTALIEHQGSGVTLSALADSTKSATVGNFLINTGTGTVSGGIIDAGTGMEVASGVTFFDIASSGDPRGVELLISTALAGALTDVFGAPDLEGATVWLRCSRREAGPAAAGGAAAARRTWRDGCDKAPEAQGSLSGLHRLIQGGAAHSMRRPVFVQDSGVP